MYPTRRLTWDDEVSISDALHASRTVKKAVSRGKAPTAAEQRILDDGKAAADLLVLAHSDLARSVAREVLRAAEISSTIDFDDLVQVGMMAMYSCTGSFDARKRSDGLDRDTGNRFSVYSRLYIRREMFRALQRASATMTGSMAAITRTREWVRAREYLEAELDRMPTAQEVSEYTGIPADAIDLALLERKEVIGQPVWAHRSDDDDGPIREPGEPELTDRVDDASVADEYGVAFARVVSTVLELDEAEAFILWMGVDRGFPRTAGEVASTMGVKVSEANEIIGRAVARLRHPQNAERVRVLALDALEAVADERAPASASV